MSPRQRPAAAAVRRRPSGAHQPDIRNEPDGPAAHHTELLRQMLLIRRFEERCVELYSAGEIHGFVHLYIGEEAVAAGVNQALSPDDAIVSTYREHGHALVRGIPLTAVMAEMYGKTTGCSGGRGGSMHLFDAKTRFYGGNAIVGGGLPLAVGIALADRMRGQSRVTACFFGDGAVAEGEFHECLNLASLWQLPVLFCCENNQYAMGTALARAQAQTDLAVRAASYGMPAWAVDGMDVLAVEQAARHAADAVRGAAHLPVPRPFDVRPGPVPGQGRGGGVEAARPDRCAGRPDAGGGRADRRCAGRHRHQPGRGARRGGRPGPQRSTGAGGGTDPLRLQPEAAMTSHEPAKITYREAMRAAIREALLADDRVFLMGEDVGRYGGCFAVSLGLLEEFGPERIRDTPLSESAFVGAGIGAAMAGMRPIVEIMTVNFSLLALDQIMNNAATVLHMSGGQFSVPLVIRMTTGAGRQVAAQHSHSLEGWYAHIPGLRIVAPATLEDARGMLASALADPDPVLIFEHGSLYNSSGVLAPGAGAVNIDHAAIRQAGTDVTLISYGGTLGTTLEAAAELAGERIAAEVIDLRTLRPLDDETIMASVRRTHRAVIVDEGWRSGSLAAEVSARIMEQAFYDLDAPVGRVCSAEVPMPYPRHLEEAALPQVPAIVAAAHQAVG
jgi:2-oxoisovalerate dehydrogenase E1 component